MKRWMLSQRDHVTLASPTTPFDSFGSAQYSQPSPRAIWSPTSDFPDDDKSHLDAEQPQLVDLPAISRLLTGDIDALLEEEERNRSSQEHNPGEIDLEFAFGEQGAVSPSAVDVVVGLPAPPRGPRKTVPRRTRSKPRRRDRLAHTSPQSSPDSSALGSSMSSTVVPTSSPSQRSFLGDTKIESEVPLGVEVMKALSEKQTYDDNSSLVSSSPSPQSSPSSRIRDTLESGHTFGNLLAASSIADTKTSRSSALLSGDGMYFQSASNCMSSV